MLSTTHAECNTQSVRSCVEILQSIEKEMNLSDTAVKKLAEFKDQRNQATAKINQLMLEREVHEFSPPTDE